ncbi:Mitochondrial outer membrane translocase complex, subunit Tom20 domain containing protein [Naviculisporaceae sp. PSN 640]
MAPSTSTIATTVAVIAGGFIAYAAYFDYRRRNDPEFRRSLRREYRRQARSEKEKAEAGVQAQRQRIKQAVDEAKEEGFPTSVEEKEAYFLEMVQNGELLGTDPTKTFDSALAFYKALKVYPTPGELINIYDKTVGKPILEILAEMIAYDGTLRLGPAAPPPNVDIAEMMREMAAASAGLD